MSNTEVNVTLADILEVYRAKVTGLEQRVDELESEVEFAAGCQKRAEEARDRYREGADRNHKLEQERAKANVELAEKVKKLEGVIESLHIELQNEREAHQTTKEN